MIIRSIYDEMEQSARCIPLGVNSKLIFRHSIRPSLKGCMDPGSVPLTPEGICLAQFFGRELAVELGAICTSDVRRCRETIEAILEARHQIDATIVVADALSEVFLKDKGLFQELSVGKMGLKDLVLQMNKKEVIPGLFDLDEYVHRLLDYMFSVGNEKNTLDLFCTHDLQIMMIISLLFFRCTSRADILESWPRMLEGVFFWGTKDDFYCSWRGQIKHFVGF